LLLEELVLAEHRLHVISLTLLGVCLGLLLLGVVIFIVSRIAVHFALGVRLLRLLLFLVLLALFLVVRTVVVLHVGPLRGVIGRQELLAVHGLTVFVDLAWL
jgi:ABC-type siderophore export system fused ATPase/permease subunit